MSKKLAQIRIAVSSLDTALDIFTSRLGFCLDMIMPADSPSVAVVSGHGIAVRLEKAEGVSDSRFNNLKPGVEIVEQLITLGGEWKEFPEQPLIVPPIKPEFIITRYDEGDWVTGRAGMEYRDLIPGRLGGTVIASHIRIQKGGPVPDYVHYHKVLFQMIYCKAGWVRVVYEDQGEPFVMNAGDSVLQPPGIRHRVLECSDNFEVIEVGCPAIHETWRDHELELPTEKVLPDRLFTGQRFVRHIASEADWVKADGYECQDTGIREATSGVADVRILRALSGSETFASKHNFHFYFVLSGKIEINQSYQILSGECISISRCEQIKLRFETGSEILSVSVNL